MTCFPLGGRTQLDYGGQNKKMQAERMSKMRTSFARFARDDSGATAIEYALIAVGIAAVIIAAVNSLGGTLAGLYSNVNTQLSGQ